MASINPKLLKSKAAERLDSTGQTSRNMILIYTGVTVLLNLVISGINAFLDQQIGGTGGLSGMGTRSILQSIQTFLQFGSVIFTPFWNAGLVFVALQWASNQPTQPKDLLTGFRRISSIVSYQMLTMLLYFLVGMACSYLASLVFTMTPLSDPLMAVLEPMVASGTLDMTALESMPMDTLVSAYLPMLGIYALILIPVLIFLSYTLRLTPYFIMDGDRVSGMRGMVSCARAMRGHRMELFKLDLSFWWFYLVEAVLMCVCYLDMILPALGISLPFNATVAYFVCLAVYCVLELAFHLWKKAHLETTYALAYRSIIEPINPELNEPINPELNEPTN